MKNSILILFGKWLSKLVQFFNLGSGSTWPGHIALKFNPHFISELLKNSNLKIILIAGTNGKTTTAKLLQTALVEVDKKVIQNEAGANLINGVASTLLLKSNWLGQLPYDFAIFEVDENALAQVIKTTDPDYLILLNLFRDQLDRYGEINTIIANWKKILTKLPEKTKLILNADDPQIAYLGKTQTFYFGLQDAQFGKQPLSHAADSTYCPRCGSKLIFDAVAFSHLGKWHCKKCGLMRPEITPSKFAIYPLPGLYNKYNVLAATLALKQIGLTEEQIQDAFTDFSPAFGRQEIVEYKSRKIQVFLSKNPTSFNQSYTTIRELGGQTLLLVLNDRIPDGRDVSWIWDVDLPELDRFKNIFVAGDRVYDMALRIKYELGIKNYELRVKTFENLNSAVDKAIDSLEKNEKLFILPTYSAMLDVRKIITGKKIL